MAVSANAAGELADWYLYVWSDAANASASWGMFQIMGFNHAAMTTVTVMDDEGDAEVKKFFIYQ